MDSSKQTRVMEFAALAARISEDSAKYDNGACIINERNEIVGTGFGTSAIIKAILNKQGCCSSKRCTIYLSKFPSSADAKSIIQSGIKKVYYEKDNSSESYAKDMFQKEKVIFDKFENSETSEGLKHFLMLSNVLTGEKLEDSAKYKDGACIVNEEHKIVGIGFNKSGCHAVVNAILNKNSCSLIGCYLYVKYVPCTECVKMIIESGIKKIYFTKDNCPGSCEKEMFEKVEVRFEKISMPLENESSLNWEDFFMETAKLATKNSEDYKTKVGASISNKQNKLISIGYNATPNDNEDNYIQYIKDKHQKNNYMCHAEVNAVINKNCSNLRGCSIYVTHFPCDGCAEVIIEAGITEVIYEEKKDFKRFSSGEKLFDEAHIPCRKYNNKRKFDDIE